MAPGLGMDGRFLLHGNLHPLSQFVNIFRARVRCMTMFASGDTWQEFDSIPHVEVGLAKVF